MRFRAFVVMVFAGATAVACGHDWDTLDPRVTGSGGSAGASMSGPGGGSVGGGATTSTTSMTTTSGGGDGGFGGGSGGTVGTGGSVGTGGGGGSGPICPSFAIQDPNSKRCYHFESTSRTWDNQRADCQGHGANWDLASVTSAAERDFLDAQILTSGAAWIGGKDMNMTDTYTWVSGEPWSFAPWEVGDPNGGAEDCVKLVEKSGAANDAFRDDPCGATDTAPGICEGPPN